MLESTYRHLSLEFPSVQVQEFRIPNRGRWVSSTCQPVPAAHAVLVHNSIQDECTAAVLAGTQGMKIGSGFDPATQLGPLVSAEQLDRVSSYVDIGKNEGPPLSA
ncbi:MAG: aldehyde dehydrogenase family protein [Pseudonocardia sp.]|nr:MAG: aldehyde dehydrogenase family protein [Pseudonocardia sp.]